MIICGICHEEDLTEIGELDCCDHSFCFQCIQHWAQIESRCPFCKARFTTISRKELQVDKSPGDQQTDDIVRQRYPGTVVKTVQIPERNQVYLGDEEWAGEEGEDPLGDVLCMECGQGDDENNLMLCDGCERACHTYCANLDALPQADWYCWVCQETRHVDSEGISTVQATTDRPRTTLRSSLVASDFTLPRSRRRPASPGPRSELARPGRRVRRRLVRNGQQPYATSQRQASDAEMILNALERSISARDHSGQSTSCEHRRLAGLRGTWNSVRQGHRPFPAQQSQALGPSPQIPSEAPQGNSAESSAWAAFEQSRRCQERATRRNARTSAAHTSLRADSGRATPDSPAVSAPRSPPIRRQDTASNLARQAIAEARSRGRQLGPSSRPMHAPPPGAFLPDLQTAAHRNLHSMQSLRAISPPVRNDLDRGFSSRQSHRAVSPPVRQDVSRRRALEPSRHGSRWDSEDQRASAHTHEHARHAWAQPLWEERHDQPHAIESVPYIREVSNAVDTSQGFPSGLHGQSNPNLIPLQQQRRVLAAAPSQHPADPQHTQSKESLHLRSSSAAWKQQHLQHQQTQAQRQQQKPADWITQDVNVAQHPGQQQQGFSNEASALHATSRHVWQQHQLGQPPDDAWQHSRPAAAVDNGNDSSDSSTSQLASQQQAAGSRPAKHPSAVCNSPTGAARPSLQTEEAKRSAQPAAVPAPATRNVRVMNKHDAADAVKAVLKPLYASKLLDKAQFKAVAKSATQAMVDTQAAASQDVKDIVTKCLRALGLPQAASQL